MLDIILGALLGLVCTLLSAWGGWTLRGRWDAKARRATLQQIKEQEERWTLNQPRAEEWGQ